MRAFQADELVDPDGRIAIMIVDLDAIVRLRGDYGVNGRTNYHVDFSDHDSLWVTKSAFDRVLGEWKSG